MATADQKLYRELKLCYPEVPDDIVTSCMSQLGNDREKCMETLSNESPKYLYGSNQNCHVNDNLAGFADLTVTDPRPRSDSSSSNMSNTSSGSASSRPPFTSSHSLINVPGYRGPINLPADDHPSTAPIRSNDINQFLDLYSDNSAHNIPNISCNNSSNSNNNRTFINEVNTLNYGGSYGQNHSGQSPPALPPHTQQGLRPIQVQHIQTNSDFSSGSTGQQGYTYQIRIEQGGGHSNQSPSVTNRGGWTHHPIATKNFNTSYQNVTYPNNPNTAFMSDLRPLPTPQTQYNVAAEDPRSYGGPHFGGSQSYGPQHSSQTTIFLHNPAGGVAQYNTTPRIDRTIHSHTPVGGTANYNVHSSVSDPRMSPSFVRNSPVPGQTPQHQPQNNSPHRPIVVEIKSSGRAGESSGVQSHIKYFNQMAGGVSNSSGSGQQSAQMSSVIGHPSLQHVPDNQLNASYPERPYTHNRPTVINIQGAVTSQDKGGFLKFPLMPNECRVPGHPHCPVTNSSSESEQVIGTELDYRQRPYLSPASSHSSLSSESSAVRERPRSGSIQDEPAYLQALLSHQKSRMDKLIEDLKAAENRVAVVKEEVTTLEQRVIERKRKKSSIFPSSADLARMRGDNLQLQADIQMMTREIDLFNNGQTPLGVLDPLEQQNFYKNMHTGPRGSIYGKSQGRTPQTFTSTVTTSVTSTALTPTRPPPEIPPTVPPRDTPGREVPPPLPPRVHQVPPAPPHQPTVNSGDSEDGEQWSCSACTLLNHPALNKCECCEMPRVSMTSTVTLPSATGDIPDTYPSPVQSAQST